MSLATALAIAQLTGVAIIPTVTTASVYSLIRRHESRETTLRCLASRCIAQHKIAYKDLVPAHLESFVQLHSAEKL